MTTKLSLFAAGLALLFFGCVKNQSKNESTSDLITKVHAFFDKTIVASGKTMNADNYRANQPKSLLWDQATLTHLSGIDVVSVPIAYRNNLYVSFKTTPNQLYRLNDITSLVITRDSSNLFHAAVVTFVPDSSSRQNKPGGLFFVEDWEGITIYGPVHTSPQIDNAIAAPTAASDSKEADYTQSIQVCNEIDGYNYSPDDPDGGIAWSETSCTTYGFAAQDPAAGIPVSRLGSLPVSRYLPPLEVIVSPPTSAISDIVDYMKCFTNGPTPGHTYSVQVCVDQPDPGTRQAWGLTADGAAGTSAAGNPVNVGHTFLTLTENDQGNIITRNIGFYPSTFVFVTSNLVASQGILGNDQSHTYNISLTITVSSSQFFNILNYAELGNNMGFIYNLNTNNCTTFALNALAAGGISLPSTQGTWPGGAGNDPGDLGEDIRNMPLSSNMTRNTVENDHPNVGTCN